MSLEREDYPPLGCDACGAVPAPLQCAGCSAVRYCNPVCQKAGWTGGHNKMCKRLKKAKANGYYVKTLTAAPEGAQSPAPGTVVVVHYTGTLANGSKFDSSRDRGSPFEFACGMGNVIQGWDTCVAQMKYGQRAMLYLSPAYGYGSQGAGEVIPPNAFLVFDVELIKESDNPDDCCGPQAGG